MTLAAIATSQGFAVQLDGKMVDLPVVLQALIYWTGSMIWGYSGFRRIVQLIFPNRHWWLPIGLIIALSCNIFQHINEFLRVSASMIEY